MTTKKAAKKTTPADSSPAAAAAPAAPAPTNASAISTLKSLISKKPEDGPVAGPLAGITTIATDPAIAGATRKGKSSVVTLGFDPAIAEEARECAELKAALEIAQGNFKVTQGKLRDYGAGKRGVYNTTYKTDVTTVSVPYVVEVPVDENSETPGKETRYVQVVCQNKYSVSGDVVRANKDQLGDWYGELFTEDKKKVLKPNAEELFRQILSDQGIVGDALEAAMGMLFDEEVSVDTVEAYEEKEKKAPEAVRTLLAQSVTRVSPSLRFPGT